MIYSEPECSRETEWCWSRLRSTKTRQVRARVVGWGPEGLPYISLLGIEVQWYVACGVQRLGLGSGSCL